MAEVGEGWVLGELTWRIPFLPGRDRIYSPRMETRLTYSSIVLIKTVPSGGLSADRTDFSPTQVAA